MLDAFPENKNNKLKSRARKGIPDAFRGYAWQALSQTSKEVVKDKSKYF